MRLYWSAQTRVALALVTASLTSIGLFFAGAMRNHSMSFSYLMWNLFLAWLPLIFTVLLERILRRKLWSSWLALAMTALWLIFLPNSFYMISDFIHIQDVRRVDILYDVIMMTSFIVNGVILGYLSVYSIHRQLVARLRPRNANVIIGLVFFLCSFAIYLGRDLRWNSWDVLVNPGGILIDVSDRILNPTAYPLMFTTTIGFTVLLVSFYGVVWQVARALRNQRTEP